MSKRVAPEPGTKEMKEQFALAPGYRCFNHGSYGAPPRCVIEASNRFREQSEARPDTWMRGVCQDEMRGVRNRLAQYLNADADDLVLVENTSSAVNAVLRSIPFNSGEIVLDLSTAYAMNRELATYLADFRGVEVLTVGVEFPGNKQRPMGKLPSSMHDNEVRPLVDAIKTAIDRAPDRVSLAIIDHISSVPAVKFPLEEIVRACAERGVPVLVDAAHSIGQGKVDLRHLQQLGVHYWVSNAHKWLLAQRGAAVFWVAKPAQELVVPTVISATFQTGVRDWGTPFLNRFQYTGTRDYSSFCAIGECLSFREAVGEEKIVSYINELALWSQDYLAEAWGTEALLPDDMVAGGMVNVRLPLASLAGGRELQRLLRATHDMELLVYELRGYTGRAGGRIWCRVCAQVYLDKSDYEALAQAVLAELPEAMRVDEAVTFAA